MAFPILLHLVFVADLAGRFQFTLQIPLNRCARISGRADDNFDIPLIENLYRAVAHAARQDGRHMHIRKEVGQKARLVARIGDGTLRCDATLLRIKDVEILTMPKMRADAPAVARYRDSHDLFPL